MNIHEHQAKEILKEFGAPVSNGVVILSIDEINEEIKKSNSKEYVLKAQIHAGGRGKAGGVKLVKNLDELNLSYLFMLQDVASYNPYAYNPSYFPAAYDNSQLSMGDIDWTKRR